MTMCVQEDERFAMELDERAMLATLCEKNKSANTSEASTFKLI